MDLPPSCRFQKVFGKLWPNMPQMQENWDIYLFESSCKKPYSDRSMRRMLEKYSEIAELNRNISPQQLG